MSGRPGTLPPSKARVDMTGRRFGMLKVVLYAGTVDGHSAWHCLCDCGRMSTPRATALRRGETKSCGCQKKRAPVHGDSRKGRWAAEYGIYSGIRTRCLNPHSKSFPNYGGRGITICDRWLDGDGERSGYACFVADIGRRPSPDHTVDRVDNDGPYSPENCRWATRKEQARNQRGNTIVEVAGRSMTLVEAQERMGIPASTYASRRRAGWTVERAISEPVHAEFSSR